MFGLWVAWALAAPVEDPPPTPVGPVDPAERSLRVAVEAFASAYGRAAAEAAGARELLEAASTLLDDRQAADARVAAARQLGRDGGPEALALLRAAARDADPAIREEVARAALSADGPGSVAPAQRVASDRTSPRATAFAVVDALGDDASDDAGRVLWQLSGDPQVVARVRARSLDTLEQRYPDLLARLGPGRAVVDPLGGVAFVGANGLAGGILLSSVGVWGKFEAAPTIGAVGGGAIGLGGGALFLGASPVTAGEGLAYASGVSWGLAAGALATTTAYGRWAQVPFPERAAADDGGAAFRALGVGLGAGLGAFAMSRDPDPWDVVEVDTATYLGSAVVLAGTGLATYRADRSSLSFDAYERRSSQGLAASTLVGAGLGATGGLLLADRWSLDWHDGTFAFTLGLEGAWIGTWAPAALGVDDQDLKGTIRLPWHLAVIGGLVVSELQPVAFGRSASTGWSAASANALGAGLPLLAGDDRRQVVAQVMVPLGAAGTLGGYLLFPAVEPEPGDWTMVGVGTGLAATEGALLGIALDDLGAFSQGGTQVAGLSLTTAGVAGLGLWGLSAAVDPKPDEVLLVGAGATWGGFYGLLVPVAARVEDREGMALVPTATVAVGALGAGIAELPAIGLRPGATVVPQLAALSGATGGALFAAMLTDEGADVAAGALIGSAAGFGVGAAVQATRPRRSGAPFAPLVRLPGCWSPLLSVAEGDDGEPVPVAGLSAHGW